jgi:hypothetical protein
MAEASTGDPRPLDDVMLAMDVVDTLRHNQRLVERELSTEQRDQALLERLREIYTAQGIEVTDAVLEEGVKALEEERFRYTPTAAGLQTWLATVYVRRERWSKPLLAGVALIIILASGYHFGTGYWEQRQAEAVAEAPQRLAEEIDLIGQMAKGETALKTIEALRARGETAVAAADGVKIGAVEADLRALRARLEQEYVVRVVSRPGETSGVYRVPADNPSARNYYLIVEAIGTAGEALALPVTSEEDGDTKTVKQWGIRVHQRDYETVAADKRDDGIIQNRDIGTKERGFLEPRYGIRTPGGAITAW